MRALWIALLFAPALAVAQDAPAVAPETPVEADATAPAPTDVDVAPAEAGPADATDPMPAEPPPLTEADTVDTTVAIDGLSAEGDTASDQVPGPAEPGHIECFDDELVEGELIVPDEDVAAEAPAIPEPPETPASSEETLGAQNALVGGLTNVGEDASWFERFVAYEAERILRLDPYGVTSQLPRGWMKVKWDTGFIRAGSRFNRFGERGPVFEPLSFEVDGDQILEADLGFGGYGHGYTLQMSYGIIDALDWYIEHTWTFQHVSINPSLAPVDDEGNYIHPDYAPLVGVDDPAAYDAEEFIYGTFPMLGRPTPDTDYHARWMRGDINTGFSWNYFRNSRMSAAVTPRIFLPTGYVPDPNSSIFYGTGPALETSTGGWATSVTQGLDFRLFRAGPWVQSIASTETTVGYAFRQQRPYPTNFVQPDELAQQLDPSAFPDLSGLEGTFDYTPGISVDWYAKMDLMLGPFGVSGGYGIKYSQEPLMGADTDPNFMLMVDSLEIMGSQTQHLVQAGASLSLLPLFIPGNIGASYTYAVGGQNAIVFDDYWIINAEIFLPVFALWNPRPWENDE